MADAPDKTLPTQGIGQPAPPIAPLAPGTTVAERYELVCWLFLRGLGARSLYRDDTDYEALLDLPIEQVRERLRIGERL